MPWPSEIYSRVARLVQYSKMNQCYLPYNQAKEGKSYDHMNGCRKSAWQNLTYIHDKNSKTKDRREVDKEHLRNTRTNILKKMSMFLTRIASLPTLRKR